MPNEQKIKILQDLIAISTVDDSYKQKILDRIFTYTEVELDKFIKVFEEEINQTKDLNDQYVETVKKMIEDKRKDKEKETLAKIKKIDEANLDKLRTSK